MSDKLSSPEVILASASPRRTELLHQIGVAHRVVPAQVDERRADGESAEGCVRRLATSKALEVQTALMAVTGADASVGYAVLGADTAVVIDELLLGKPRDRDDALAMLARLSGRTHHVLTAVALAGMGGVQCQLSRSEVRFRRLSERECAAYWDSGEPRDKAGAYAIQGLGAQFVEELRGSYSGVMGLPLFETASLLSAAGVPVGRRSSRSRG
ncbi:MAG TPA: Maf family protein [Steroidobacteraceae bacterium]|jgi:septum formation protein